MIKSYTDIEQSKKLAEILPPESADMCYPLSYEDGDKPFWSEKDYDMVKETIYFINEFQKSNRCKNENDMQNSVTCMNWLKSIKQAMKGGEE